LATGTPRECYSAKENAPPFSPGFSPTVLFIISLTNAEGAGLGETYLPP